MKFPMKNNTGFTLIELLIALLISSFIMMGAYALLDTTLNTRESLGDRQNYQKMYKSIYKIINDDIISSDANEINVRKDPGSNNDEISFTTQNSIYFTQSIPVNVRYYVEDNYLIREENHFILHDPEGIKLVGGVEEFSVEGYDGNEFTDRNFETKMLKFRIQVNGRIFEVITGAFQQER